MQDSNSEVIHELRDLLVQVAGINHNKVQPNARFVEDLGMDSLTMLELLLEAEERFGVEISQEDLPRLKSVGEFVQYLNSNATVK
ncbi:acyl carrier protein [Cyanobium sp. Morenito 9A2]|uniref:acyl carrier protein n=1 Tax=Cyanobium sp. Morenito 9A2 TaxID=2823718 RepID=UPI0020CD5F26|nr:acyl carrier protein [Cyanobium sp. Morenito 9A2]MCP9851222.1 acyl carrier protein [Cyanobium sp. Morenito 9A2]